MSEASSFLVRTLVAEGVITDADARRAHEHAATEGRDVVESLVALGLVSAQRLAIERAVICEYPYVDLGVYEVDIRNAALMPRALAERVLAFPLFCIDGHATVGMADPLNLQALDQVRQVLKAEVDPVLCDAEQLRATIAKAYSLVRGAAVEPPEAREGEEQLTTGDEPIVAALNQILASAAEAGASDVHISPDEHELVLRYRVDGVLIPQQGPPRSVHAGLIQRLKVMAHLDLTQTRRPQDGKFRFQHRGESIDARLSLVPTIHGENAVMRLLRPSSAIGSIASLNMPAEMAEHFRAYIERPHGMILVTGPTGSGKTTTLYTALAHLNTPDVNIMTIEDPVEIRLPLIRQIQVNAEIGLTFASALRAILRQDPDAVLVGEIRDQETARIAVQASMTGHLVLSTLHTNDAVGAVARLRDFGLPAFAINSALLCAIAQRLVRRVCPSCAEPDHPDPAVLARLGGHGQCLPAGASFQRGRGCPRCLNTGVKGRLGVFEMLRVTPQIQQLIEADATSAAIRQAGMAEGMRPMWEDGFQKAALGLTPLSELCGLRGIEDEDAPAARKAA